MREQSKLGNDLGFGVKPTVNDQPIMNRDGSTNIKRKGLPVIRNADTYNSLITMSWSKFLFLILVAYLAINTLFAYLYMLIGIEHLNGVVPGAWLNNFFDAFFFSAQTISTVGYGHISPKGFITSLLAAIESMLGLLSFALATGLLYGRFSRPSAKIMYSENMVIAPFEDGEALMFRLANYRSNQLIEIEAQVLFSMNVNENGNVFRKYWPLNLERNKISILTLSWTVVHPINSESPLWELTTADLKENKAEFIIFLKAFDDTFSQTVHSRTSYSYERVVWKAKFKSAIETDSNGILTLDMGAISDYELLTH
ncbi:MAG: ion transporter [Sphingobacteriales bacterium]|nr:ion transporter [Sphingobacteriales bacterium]